MRKCLIFEGKNPAEQDEYMQVIEAKDGCSLQFDIGVGPIIILSGDEVYKLMKALGGGYSGKELHYLTSDDLASKKRVEERMKLESEEQLSTEDD